MINHQNKPGITVIALDVTRRVISLCVKLWRPVEKGSHGNEAPRRKETLTVSRHKKRRRRRHRLSTLMGVAVTTPVHLSKIFQASTMQVLMRVGPLAP
jgi:hypothetical protein